MPIGSCPRGLTQWLTVKRLAALDLRGVADYRGASFVVAGCGETASLSVGWVSRMQHDNEKNLIAEVCN